MMRYLLGAVAVIVAALAVAVIVILTMTPGPVRDARAVAYKIVNGVETSKVKIVQFVDYSCGYCYQMDKILVEAVGDDADVVVIVRPLAYLAPESKKIGAMVMAASLQNRGYELHMAIMQEPEPITPEQAEEKAKALNLDMARLKEDADSPGIEAAFDDNIAILQNLGLNSVPAFIFGDAIFKPQGRMPTPGEFKQFIARAR